MLKIPPKERLRYFQSLMITLGKYRFVFILSIVFPLSSCVIVDVDSPSRGYNDTHKYKVDAPSNIIMVVADGMGPAYVTAYRMFKDNPDTHFIESTIFDQFLVGTSRTHPHHTSGLITDSAASATAMATGVKTYNGAIGMDANKIPLETVLHRAHKYGLATGLAVTSQIVHATPASYMVANEARRNYNQIADSFFDDKINGEHLADVMLGGGWDYFIREDRNLVDEFKLAGYEYVDSYEALNNVSVNSKVLGLFGDRGLPWALDDSDTHRLKKLTKSAVNHLEGHENGFFLLVEASQVDWAGHANDIASAMAEMDDLAKTMEFLYEYANNNPNTLVVLTADHSTGGLTIGSDGEYRWSPEYLKDHKRSITAMSKVIRKETNMGDYFASQVGYTLTEDELQVVATITSDMTEREVAGVLRSIVDKRTNTGWTTSGHTGVDVEVFAIGPGSKMFVGNQNNTDIAHKLFELLDRNTRNIN